MIELALKDLRRKPTTYEYNSANDWMFRWNNAKFSFEFACEMTGLDGELIRRWVCEYLESGQRVPKIGIKEIKERKKKEDIS
jgi:hypothetical protein